MRPAVAPHYAYRESAAEVAVEGVVVSDGGDPREKVLETADEEPIPKGVGSALENPKVLSKLRAHVVDPERRVLVRVAELQSTEMVELEMVVGVHQAGEYVGAFDVDHDVFALGGRVDSQNPAGKADGGGGPPFRRDPSIDQRYRTPPHEVIS
jgi:hypothetical protein